MEGGLDDTDLLTLGSPKVHPEPDDDKENVDNVDFARPKNPSPKKHLRFPVEIPGNIAPIAVLIPIFLNTMLT